MTTENEQNNGKNDAEKRKNRQKHTGTLEKRGKVFIARWTFQGKRYAQSTGKTTRKEALKVLEELTAPFVSKTATEAEAKVMARIRGRQEEERQAEEKKPALRIADAWAAYLESTERPDTGEETLKMYGVQVCRFAGWMAAHFPDVLELRGVEKSHAEAFMTELAATRSANTYNKYRMLLAHVWRVLGETAKLKANPWEAMHKKHEQPKERRELTVEELTRVCNSLSGDMRLLFAVGIYTGLRLGDAVALDWGEIDLIKGVIRLTPHKTAKTRRQVVIPIHSTLRAMLAEAKDRTGKVFPTMAESYCKNHSGLTKKIQGIFNAAGIQTQIEKKGNAHKAVVVGFHSLRHTFVSLCANGGVPLALVQSIVGHSNPAMTRHYFHESLDALKGAVDALPAIGGTGAVPMIEAERADASRIEAFKGLVATMSGAELAEAAAILEARRKELTGGAAAC